MCNCTGDKCQICGSCQCDDCSNACRCGSLFDSSESSSSKSRKEYAEASAHLGDFAEGSCDGHEGGDEPRRPGLRKVLFAVIIICVMVLVGTLTLTILEHTGVIVWDQTKPGVESWTTWGQYVAISLSVLGIGLLSWGRWKAGQPDANEKAKND